MGLNSVAVVTLSVGITKALIKLWFNDRSLLMAAGYSTADLLGLKIKNALERRRVERHFADVGEHVAESIGQLFELERVEVDEGGQQAVAEAVQVALDDPLLSPRGMVDADLDVDRVARALVEAHSSRKRDFSEAEASMFDRMLMEATRYTFRIIQTLPNFQPTALAAILRTQSETLDAVKRVLADIGRMWEIAEHNADRRMARFEANYRRAVEQKLNRVQLFGIIAGTRAYPLTVAFVALEAEQRAHADDGLMSQGAVHEVLGREGDRLWISGPAGAGKTTLLQWLAVQVAVNDLPEPLAHWRGRVPFFIRLRKFHEGSFPPPPDWVGATVPPLEGSAPVGWVGQQLEGRRAVILIDGVDEIPELQRSAFGDWIDDFMRIYPGNIWVFSSRPLLASSLHLDDVREISLRSMGERQVEKFIAHWHSAVSAEGSDSDGEDLAELAERLHEQLRDRPSLRRLIASPLLCALVCALHRDRRALLPDGRRGLFEACTEMLLVLRDRQRNIRDGVSSRMSLDQKKGFLADLAYFMLRNDLTILPIAEMDAQFQRTMPRLGLSEDLTIDDIRRFMVERSGLLRIPEPDSIDFRHKSFLEFLGASAILEAGDIRYLVGRATESGWHEVILHVASQCRTSQSGQLIQELLKRAEEESIGVPQLVLLALAASHEASSLDPDTRNQLHLAVDRLGRPQGAEAEQWAAVGEFVVPMISVFLGDEPVEVVAAACVRVLAQVSSPSSIDALVRHMEPLQRPTTRLALVDSLRLIVPELYHRYSHSLLHPWFYRVAGQRVEVNLTAIGRPCDSQTLADIGRPLSRCLRNYGSLSQLVVQGPGAARLALELCKHYPEFTSIAMPAEALSDLLQHEVLDLLAIEEWTLWNKVMPWSGDLMNRIDTFLPQLKLLCLGDTNVSFDRQLWRLLPASFKSSASNRRAIDTSHFWSDPWWAG